MSASPVPGRYAAVQYSLCRLWLFPYVPDVFAARAAQRWTVTNHGLYDTSIAGALWGSMLPRMADEPGVAALWQDSMENCRCTLVPK